MIRSTLSFLCWVVAVVAAIITIPTFWLATHVAEEDGYVKFTSSFVGDVELRNALVSQIADDVVRTGGLPAVVKLPLEGALRSVVRESARQPGFVEAWEESQRRTHQLTFGPDSKTDRLTADIGPIASFMGKQATKDLPVRVTFPDTLRVPIYGAPDREVLDQVQQTPERSRLGLLVVVLASVLCLLFARRRINAIIALAAGALLTAGLLVFGTRLALPEVLDRTPAPTPFARQMRDLLVDRASDSLNDWLLGIAVVAAVVLVLGLLGRALPQR
ncbi:hypothetical protein [Aeromicrobium sp.]|uniref:hypothetical protein n=1 Tax=Aeromicrobium sp. TaxID=1871063 RepID=UPI003D6B6707